MTRYDFGGTVPDFIFSTATVSGTANLLQIPASASLTFWTAKTGGTQHTDIRLTSNPTVPTSTVTVGSDGQIPQFQGPDGVTQMWATAGLTRVLMNTWTNAGAAGGSGGSASDATTTSKGIVQLAGDLGGTAASPTVPGLAGKAATVHTHTASQISDSTATGQSLIRASNALAGRTVLDAPSNADVAPIVGKPIVAAGTTQFEARSAIAAADAAAVLPYDLTGVTDGDGLLYDATQARFEAVDLTTQLAAIGTDGRIVASAQPRYYVPILVINEGDPVPSTFPVSGIVFTRPAAASIIPVSAGANYVQNGTAVAVTTTQAFAVGDYIGFSIGASGEVTLPTTYTVSYATGAGAKSVAVTSFQTGTAQTDIQYAKVTTAIPSGTVVTVTANQTRVHLLVQLLQMPNLAATAFDVAAGSSGGATSQLALAIGPTTATAVANEVAVMSITSNPGTVSRTVAGTNGWQAAAPGVISTSTSSRSLYTFYKVLTSTGTVTGTAQVSSTDGSNAAWSGGVATFKAA